MVKTNKEGMYPRVWNMVKTNKEGMYPRDKNKDGNNGKDEIET
jgi:hypothetical protein